MADAKPARPPTRPGRPAWRQAHRERDLSGHGRRPLGRPPERSGPALRLARRLGVFGGLCGCFGFGAATEPVAMAAAGSMFNATRCGLRSASEGIVGNRLRIDEPAETPRERRSGASVVSRAESDASVMRRSRLTVNPAHACASRAAFACRSARRPGGHAGQHAALRRLTAAGPSTAQPLSRTSRHNGHRRH